MKKGLIGENNKLMYEWKNNEKDIFSMDWDAAGIVTGKLYKFEKDNGE